MAWVTVDVDLREIDTDDLIEELERRRKNPEQPDDVSIKQIFEAFYVGNESSALELTKRYIQHATGRVLPV
ncbi:MULTISPECIES: hypothetical protein [Burkholderia cepacia complex]|uniref:hypothetical protein n=1 Tax=Burkholderia cepacia complex TaxID=87882 RepID=UPI0009E0CF2F|nr:MULTISPECIES: hypothetical protein [Burkholderia cepacia complex]MBU9549044.1 hypothetical protein [Burkholderia multivorans]MBY4751850.1 hypothetical protein [Burkholderia dolosa]SAK33248.1 hypothetical protein UA11_01905 [Burkholderia multivorans]